jgi:hypothetical protein
MNMSILDLQGQMAGQDVPMRERQQRRDSQSSDTVAMLQKWGIGDTSGCRPWPSTTNTRTEQATARLHRHGRNGAALRV